MYFHLFIGYSGRITEEEAPHCSPGANRWTFRPRKGPFRPTNTGTASRGVYLREIGTYW